MSKNWYRAIIVVLMLIVIVLVILYSDEVSEKSPPTIISGTVTNIVENAAGYNRWVVIKTNSGNVVTVYDNNTNFMRGMQSGDTVSVEIEERDIGYKVIGVIYE